MPRLACERPGVLLEELEEVAGETEVWVLKLPPHDLNPDKRSVHEGMDVTVGAFVIHLFFFSPPQVLFYKIF